jgi:hypothetical protein
MREREKKGHFMDSISSPPRERERERDRERVRERGGGGREIAIA